MRIFTLSVIALSLPLAIIIASSSCQSCAYAKSTNKKPPGHTVSSNYASDQIITRHADGTVEVSDSPEPTTSPNPGNVGNTANTGSTGSKSIYYRMAPPGTVHYADGTVVTRNADGSVEVSDNDSLNPQIHWDHPPTTRSNSSHKSAHHGSKTAGKQR